MSSPWTARRTVAGSVLQLSGSNDVADGGTESSEACRLDEERQGVEVVVAAAMLRDEDRPGLVGAESVLGGGALVDKLAAGIAGARVG
jgi:hypothetical protein